MATAYLDRDNELTYQLRINGEKIDDNVVTRATLFIPARATESGQDITIDTNTDTTITLSNNDTEVVFSLGDLGLKTGCYQFFLSVFDSASVNGYAWDTIDVTIAEWKPSA